MSDVRQQYQIYNSSRWRCPSCGAEKDAKAQLCSTCRAIARNTNRPPVDQIRRVLELYGWNFSAAGRFFRVSGNAVRKWCVSLDIHKEST